MIVDRRRVVEPQEFDLIARLKYVAHIIKPAHPGGAFPLFGHREDQFQAVDHAKVSAVRVAKADIVPGPQAALAIAADAVRPAGEVVQIGRQRGGTTQRRGIVHLGVEGQQPFSPNGDVLKILEIGGVVAHVARGYGVAPRNAQVQAAVGEQSPVARIVIPSGRELIGIEVGAVDRVRIVQGIDHAVAVGVREIAGEGIAVLLDPIHGLLGAVPLRDHQGVLVGGYAGLQVLVLADGVGPLQRARDLLGRERRRRGDELRDIPVGDRTGAGHTVDGGVGIRMRERVALAVFAGVDFQRDAIARSHEVAVNEVAVQADALRLGIADAAAELPG